MASGGRPRADVHRQLSFTSIPFIVVLTRLARFGFVLPDWVIPEMAREDQAMFLPSGISCRADRKSVV